MKTTSYPGHSNFVFTLSEKDRTGLQLLSVLDSRTGYVVRTPLPNDTLPTASIMAFAGARFSRSSLNTEELFTEIADLGDKAQQRLASIFRNYGHASVADMAQLFAYIENVPQLHAFRFFYETSVGGGQERSTRYQDFGNLQPVGLQQQFPFLKAEPQRINEELDRSVVDLQSQSLHLYRKWTTRLTDSFSKVFDVDPQEKKFATTLQARVFDSSRSFLLSGHFNRTSLAWITSAREWARIISLFKASTDQSLICLAEQLEVLFAPDESFASTIGYVAEAPDLIRYTTADETTKSTLSTLKTLLDSLSTPREWEKVVDRTFSLTTAHMLDSSFSAAEKVIAQNILCLYPTLETCSIIDWIRSLPQSSSIELSRTLFGGFTHHRQMGNQCRVNELSFRLSCSIGEARDLNRHRAWGRFTPLHSTVESNKSLLSSGYTLPQYLTDNASLSAERGEFEDDLAALYQRVDAIAEVTSTDDFWLLQCLPFAHRLDYYLHGSIKELSYLTQLRVRPGGHINYRSLAFQMAELAALSDPLLAGMALPENLRPNASSREEFLDRS